MAVALGSGTRDGNGRRRRRAQPMHEINVTPMVDVMLVLLIVFYGGRAFADRWCAGGSAQDQGAIHVRRSGTVER